MARKTISRARLILNGIGCIAIAALLLPIGLPGAIELAFGPPLTEADADGKGKVLLVQAFCALFGTIALGSLYRTVRAWRRLPRKEELS